MLNIYSYIGNNFLWKKNPLKTSKTTPSYWAHEEKNHIKVGRKGWNTILLWSPQPTMGTMGTDPKARAAPWGADGLNPTLCTPPLKTCSWDEPPKHLVLKTTGLRSKDPWGPGKPRNVSRRAHTDSRTQDPGQGSLCKVPSLEVKEVHLLILKHRTEGPWPAGPDGGLWFPSVLLLPC